MSTTPSNPNGSPSAEMPERVTARHGREERESEPPPDSPGWFRAGAWAARNSTSIARLLGVLLLPAALVAAVYALAYGYRDWRAEQAAWRAAQRDESGEIVVRLQGLESEARAMRADFAREGEATRRVLEAIRDGRKR